MSDTRTKDIIWAAGFIDGDGSIGIYKHKRKDRKSGRGYRTVPVVSAVNTDLNPIFKLKTLFGGYISKTKAGKKYPSITLKSDIWRWEIQYRKALKVIKVIYPFLVTYKKEKAMEIIKYYAEMDGEL